MAKASDASTLAVAIGAGSVGAALMYFLDPLRGRKRRARIGEAVTHARRVERTFVDKALRDARYRTHGFGHRPSAEVDDEVLGARIRARLGRAVSHAHAISISVCQGEVELGGDVLAAEAGRAITAVRTIPGVRRVHDALARHATADTPALQGGGIRRGMSAWPPSVRLGAIALGGTAALLGIARKRPLTAVAGAALAVRAATNRPLSRSGEVRFQKAVTVRAPIDQVYALWNRFEAFPRFMESVRDVRVDGDRSTWTIQPVPGMKMSFDAEITRREPNKLIAWRTLPGQSLAHSGTVHFAETPQGTRVQVEMSYRPPAGLLGYAIARLFGADPGQRLARDFIRIKGLLETGHTRANHHRVDLAAVK